MGYRSNPSVRKRIIGNHLRRLREHRGMSMEDVSAELGVSRAAAYRQETGHTAVSVADAEKYIRMYQVQGTALADRITDLARISRKKGWWTGYRDAASMQVEIADLEDFSSRLCVYETTVLPGLIQTEGYSQSVIGKGTMRARHEGVDITENMALRTRRKALLSREDRPEVRFVFSEAALHVQVGNEEIMRDQARHLLELSWLPRVSLRVLPFSSGYREGCNQSFMVVSLADPVVPDLTVPDAAYVSGLPLGSMVDETGEVKMVEEIFFALEKESLSTGDTTDLIARTFSLESSHAKKGEAA